MSEKSSKKSRREFIKASGATAAAVLALPNLSFAFNDSQTLKVGLVGCGGRGSGAANQALTADSNVVLSAMADIFPDKMEKSLTNLKELHPEKVHVDKSNQFIGFDAYRQLIDSDVDVVLLATPPAFRPDHLLYAVKKGKHVFCEKPMAVDIPGLNKVYEAARLAKEKEISLMSGFCWRYHFPKRASFAKIEEGAIGKVTAIYNTYNTGYLWEYPREDDWTNLEYQLRNWIYYNWLSGDHIAEQAIHSLDMMLWAMDNKMPVKAVGTGGRQRRIEDRYGNVFDHFAVSYEWQDGTRGFHFSRQQKDTARSYYVEAMGTEGTLMVDCIRRKHEITGKNKWKYEGEANNMYQTEHDELFAAIRGDRPINDGQWMADSTLLAIWGRMVAYTGEELTIDEVRASKATLGPAINEYEWNLDWSSAPVARPGITAFR